MKINESDKIALVTGASRGIGRAIAIRLASDGFKIGLNYCSSEKKAIEVMNYIKDAGGECVMVKANVGIAAEVAQMFNTIETSFGSTPTVLVNNAGIAHDNQLISMSEEEFDSVININLKGAFLCMREAARRMIPKKYGKIINISSVVGFTGNPEVMNYAASKGGLHSMTRTMAAELGSAGIRVNSIAPGLIKTDMTDSIPQNLKEQMIAATPLKSFGNVDDIAATASFLASPESDFITGQVIHVNGGIYM